MVEVNLNCFQCNVTENWHSWILSHNDGVFLTSCNLTVNSHNYHNSLTQLKLMSLTCNFLLMLYLQQDNTQLLPLSCGVIKQMQHNMLTLNGCISPVVLSDMNFLYICTVWKYWGTIKFLVTAMHVHWSVCSYTMVENKEYVDFLTFQSVLKGCPQSQIFHCLEIYLSTLKLNNNNKKSTICLSPFPYYKFVVTFCKCQWQFSQTALKLQY